jgi:hypothetical protein
MATIFSSAIVVIAASTIALWLNDRFPLGGYIDEGHHQ